MPINNPSTPGATFTELAGGHNHGVAVAGVWEDWDISAIVPVGTMAVLVDIISAFNAAGAVASGARADGSALVRTVNIWRHVGDPHSIILTECPATRVIEVICNDALTTDFSILGYWS